MKNVNEIFSEIYSTDRWKGGSGPGSYPDATIEYRKIIVDVIKKYNIKSILDYGCGDWQFSKLIPWEDLVTNYLGVDVVPQLINHHKKNFSNDLVKFDLIVDDWKFPKVDLIICKDVLQHLPNSMVKNILEKMEQSGTYLLITNDTESRKKLTNIDCEIGSWRPIDLTKSPWNMKGDLLLSKDVIKLKKETVLFKL